MATPKNYYIYDEDSRRLDADDSYNNNPVKIRYGDRTTWGVNIRTITAGVFASANWADAVTFRAAFAQDFNHKIILGFLTAAKSGAVTAIKADGFSQAPPAAGYIHVTNGADESEHVFYSSYTGTWASAATELTFNVNTTLAYSYAENDSCDADESPPLVRINNSLIDSTNKASAQFLLQMDALNPVLEAALDEEADIDGFFEFVGIDANGYEIHSVLIPAKGLNAADPGGGGTLSPPMGTIPRLLILTSAPACNTALSTIDPTAPVGSWGIFAGYKYTWHAAAANHREPIENSGY